MLAGVGPGSSARDYAAAGVPFDERRRRFDESVLALRALLGQSPDGFPVEPRRAAGPPLWIASWGSRAGLRRVARLGDGWLASAYNATPYAAAGAQRCFLSPLSDERRQLERVREDVVPMIGANTSRDATATTRSLDGASQSRQRRR